MEAGVPEAATQLGVSPERVRQLIHDGVLPASRVSGRWILDSGDVRRLVGPRPPGRPLAPRTAWGLLALAEGRVPEWLNHVERSRLRARLRARPQVGDLASSCRRRSEVHRLRGHRSIGRHVLALPGVVRTGSAARGHDVLDLRRVEVYLRPAELRGVVEGLGLERAHEDANVIVRVPPAGLWPFSDSEAGPATVAVDLWDAGDPRARRAATRLFDRLLQERRFEPGWRGGE